MEVHAPEHPIHTWRDFFIHIATIVVGLLIAIGLEQSVEWLHHRSELRETREALQREREDNREAFQVNTLYLRHNINALRNNLTVLVYLKQHPGTKGPDLPGRLIWPNLTQNLSDIAWKSAQTANMTQLMPREEASENAMLYDMLNALSTAGSVSWEASSKASAYAFRDPDPTHLSPADLDREIDLTQDALLSKFRFGVEMANVGISFKDFKGGPTLEEMNKLSIAPEMSEDERKQYAKAVQITRDRMTATPLPQHN